MPLKNPLKTTFGMTFDDLYQREGLVKLDRKFGEYLREKDVSLAEKFSELQGGDSVQKSNILINVARILEDFLVELFNIENENSILKKHHEDLKIIYQIRRDFVQRVVAKKIDAAGFEQILKQVQDDNALALRYNL